MCACDSRETVENRETVGIEESIEREERGDTVSHTHIFNVTPTQKRVSLTPGEEVARGG